LKQKETNSITRLYYQSVTDDKKKKDYLKKIKDEKTNDFINKFSFKPKILYHKGYERNYDKIEDKLIDDGKKSKEKQALKRIAKEIENRKNKFSNNFVEDNSNSNDSSLVNDEKKFTFTQESSNQNINQSGTKPQQKNFQNSLNFIQQQNNIENLGHSMTIQQAHRANYQIKIFDENNKSIIKGGNLEASLTMKNPAKMPFISSNSLNNNAALMLKPTTNLNNSIVKNSSSKNVGKNLDGKNLDSSIQRQEAQLFNRVSTNSGLTNSHTKNYTEQYLKHKNNTDTIHNLSLHQSSVSQKKNDTSLSPPQSNTKNNNKKENKEIIGNGKTTNQIIQNYNSAKKFNKSISFKNETVRSKSQSKKVLVEKKENSKEKIYSKKVIEHKRNVYRKNESEKENISYKFKVNKKEMKTSATIYEHSKLREKAKEDHINHIKTLEYSFTPVLTESSKKYISKSLSKYENKDQFLKRMTNSKRMKVLSMNFDKKSTSSTQNFSYTPNSHSYKKNIRRSFSNKSTYTKIITTTEETDLRSYRNTITGATFENAESSRIREVKQNKDLIENIKHQQIKEKKMLNNCTDKILDNINKFKLNNLKEIFEVIYNNCTNIDDIENIETFGVSSKIKDKLVLPTCHQMKERNLEFNFQNFFLVANDIINLTLEAEDD